MLESGIESEQVDECVANFDLQSREQVAKTTYNLFIKKKIKPKTTTLTFSIFTRYVYRMQGVVFQTSMVVL